MRTWLAARTDIEPIATVLTTPSFVWFATYGSLAIDLLAVPLMLWRRSRPFMFGLLVVFHLTNVWVFGLYIFPWLMIAATTLFFEPDWPIRLRNRLADRHARFSTWRTEPTPGRLAARRRVSPVLAAALGLWVLVQVALPLRHFAIPGNSNWTEEGHMFAWHMMLRDKRGTVVFELTDGDSTWQVDPRDHLTGPQAHELAWYPAGLVQFAHHLSDIHDGAEVRAITSVSLNGRTHQPIVDPEVDLASLPTTWRGHASWIVPLD